MALAIQVYFFSNKVRLLLQLIYCVSLNGSTTEYYYSRQLHRWALRIQHRDNEYSFDGRFFINT
jgi:hypothetical protein